MALRRRRAWARWLIALLLLPMVLGILPASQLSAEQTLERDLALSMCSPHGLQDQGTLPVSHDGQCVLCTIGCAGCAPCVPQNPSAFILPCPSAAPTFLVAAVGTLPHRSLRRDGSPPRGPPLSLLV